jgi:hypothetical protein
MKTPEIYCDTESKTLSLDVEVNNNMTAINVNGTHALRNVFVRLG